jgi:hypothetical protein
VIAVPRPEFPPDAGALGLAAHVLGGLDELTVGLVAGLA